MTVTEAAAAVGRKYCRRGKIGAVKKGLNWWIPEEEVHSMAIGEEGWERVRDIPPGYFKTEQAAKILFMSAGSLRLAIKQGKVEARKIWGGKTGGRAYAIPKKEVERIKEELGI